MPSIIVDDKGTELAYLDSGAPCSSPDSYVTIFAIHGTVFTGRESTLCPIARVHS